MALACLLWAWFAGTNASLAQPADPLEESTRLAAEASRLWSSSDWEGAEAALLQALRLREQVQGPVHGEVARLINWIGRAYYNRQKHDLAADWFLESVEVAERALGPMHQDVAEYLGDLGAALREAGRPEQGEPHVLRSLSIRRDVFGPEAQPVGASLLNLGRNYLRQERFAEGRDALAQAVDILERTMGENAPMAREARQVIVTLEKEARYARLVTVNAAGALVAMSLLMGGTLWAETPRGRISARWVWVGLYAVMIAALIGLYATSFLATGFYFSRTLITGLNGWSEMQQGLLKLAGMIGMFAAFIALEALQNGARWMLGRPLSLTWLPQGRTEPESNPA